MNATATLSRRESQVAELIAWGASKKEIAAQLFISTRTVEATARNIYEKVGCQKASELSAWWFCTRFGISFDLSPVKRSIMSIALLLIILPGTLFYGNVMIRTPRARRVECRSGRFQRNKDQLLYEDAILL